jgi:hypothetical protein
MKRAEAVVFSELFDEIVCNGSGFPFGAGEVVEDQADGEGSVFLRLNISGKRDHHVERAGFADEGYSLQPLIEGSSAWFR